MYITMIYTGGLKYGVARNGLRICLGAFRRRVTRHNRSWSAGNMPDKGEKKTTIATLADERSLHLAHLRGNRLSSRETHSFYSSYGSPPFRLRSNPSNVRSTAPARAAAFNKIRFGRQIFSQKSLIPLWGFSAASVGARSTHRPTGTGRSETAPTLEFNRLVTH